MKLWRTPRASQPVDETGHDHGLPTSLLALITVCALGLLTAVVIVFVATSQRITALEEYVAGRGVQRDAENQRLNERLDKGFCDLLDRLPAYPDLAEARAQYACGPGLPLPQEIP